MKLVHADEGRGAKPNRLIYKVWPDFKLKPLIDRSIATVKADAAYQSYSASGAGVTWAVIDSGIDASHQHFENYKTLTHSSVAELHRDFTQPGDPDKTSAGTALTANMDMA